jgi:endonuclease III
MTPAKRHEFFSRLKKAMPEPKSELEHASAFELLVAVILSAQATDKSVNIATAKLFPVANTPQKLAAMGDEKLMEYIKTIGLFRMKAKNVVAMSAKCPANERRSKRCQAWAARPRTWCSTSPSASPPLPWTRTSFASAIARASRPARTCWTWS